MWKRSDELSYRVLPNPPDSVAISEYQRQQISGLGVGWGCLFFGILWWAVMGVLYYIWILTGLMTTAPSGVASITAVVAALLITLALSSWKRNRNLQELATREVQLEVQRKAHEADSLTAQVRDNFRSSLELAAQLRGFLDSAAKLLRNAEHEYEDNAFDPFWDAVEDAANCLASFDRSVQQLSQNAQHYYALLNGRKHTFPPFPVGPKLIPNPKPTIDQFRTIVRRGQTDFHFASIWEHRKTRTVLIAGFRTLGDAVNNLGTRVLQSVASLSGSLSSDLAELKEEEIRTRESQSEEELRTRKIIERHGREILDRLDKR